MERRLAVSRTQNVIPGDVAGLVMACLAKDPAQRPRSAREVAERIGLEALHESPPKAPVKEALPTPHWDATVRIRPDARPGKSARGRRLAAAGALAALLLLALGGWEWTRRKTTPPPARPQPAPAPAVAQNSVNNIPPPFQLPPPNLGEMPSGTVVVWGGGSGNGGPLAAPAEMGRVVAISSGGFHSLALTREGRVWAWGAGAVNTGTDPDFGQSRVPPALDHVAAVSAGWQFSLALRQDGTVVGWGRNNYGQAEPPADLTNAVAIAAGACHGVALTRDGRVRMWGLNSKDWSRMPPDLDHVIAIASGWSHVLALRTNGTVAAWGAGVTNSGKYPMFGQALVPAGLSNVIAIAAGGVHSAALKADGGVVVWGGDSPAVRAVPALGRVAAIAANGRGTLALLGDGTVVAWGQSGGSRDQVPPGLDHVIAIAAGDYQNLALTNSP
jgi:hypothetical protein